MPILTFSNEQVVELVKQLPTEQQVEVFRFLLLQQWGKWKSLSRYGLTKPNRLPKSEVLTGMQ